MTQTTDLQTIIVPVGQRWPTQDDTRNVEFTGRLLASYSGLQHPPKEDETIDESLYQLEDETMVLHIYHFSKPLDDWQHYMLMRVTVDELIDDYHELAVQIGHGRNLTLDEGLELSEDY